MARNRGGAPGAAPPGSAFATCYLFEISLRTKSDRAITGHGQCARVIAQFSVGRLFLRRISETSYPAAGVATNASAAIYILATSLLRCGGIIEIVDAPGEVRTHDLCLRRTEIYATVGCGV